MNRIPFNNGTLVQLHRSFLSNYPVFEKKKLGIVISYISPGVLANDCAISQLLVLWVGPDVDSITTLEPEHRLRCVNV